jgi:hypothetical protein
VVISFMRCLIDNIDIPYSVSFSFRAFTSSSTMEVNMILDEAGSPCRDAGLDDSMVSMKFSTPAHLTISCRHVVSPSLRKSSSKKKRLQYPDEVVSTLFSRSPSPNTQEIADPGYLPDPFDLGVSRYLRENGPDIKPPKDASLYADQFVPDESVLTAVAPVSVESVSIDSLLMHSRQTAEIKSMTASNVVSILAIDESLPQFVFPLDEPEVLIHVNASDPPLSVECVVNDTDKAISVSVDESILECGNTPAEVSSANLFDDHQSAIDFFEGSDDLFDMFVPLNDLADEDVDRMDVINSDGDDEGGNESGDNPGFYWFGNASAKDLGIVKARGERHSAKVEQWAARAFDD